MFFFLRFAFSHIWTFHIFFTAAKIFSAWLILVFFLWWSLSFQIFSSYKMYDWFWSTMLFEFNRWYLHAINWFQMKLREMDTHLLAIEKMLDTHIRIWFLMLYNMESHSISHKVRRSIRSANFKLVCCHDDFAQIN